MNMQMVSSTYVQRNIRKILDSISRPIIIIRDSKPVAVLIPYEQYLEITELVEKTKSKKSKGLRLKT